jgi:hypothetical protein
MKKSLVLKNKKRINRDMKDTTIATWFWSSRPGHVVNRKKIRRFRGYKNLHKAILLDFLIALKNFERKNT